MTLSLRGGMASRTLCQSFSGDSAPSVLLNHVIDSDEPVSLGGEGVAPDPQEQMLTAFNACMMAAFIHEAMAEGLAITHLEIQTGVYLTKGILATRGYRSSSNNFALITGFEIEQHELWRQDRLVTNRFDVR
ncbi:OsmC family protein [Enterobacter hormaechei subsp. steigerwaltii]|uniref:OsmC family protein n=1 Tax=Enterobacteriaceae TaxID=543 RepID=UPI0036F49AB1